MEFEKPYDEVGGKICVPPGKKDCLMWSAGWARGVLMLIEECEMLLRGAKPGQGGPTGVEERSSSGAAILDEHCIMGRDVQSLE
jgi:hypothetical protein